MLVFVIPLRGKESARDWERVCRCCERTLRSACGQSHEDFRVVLVCSDRPEISFSHPNLDVIVGHFPVVRERDRQAQMLDKIRKIEHGLIYANQFRPDYLMKLDADDCVSRKLVEYVHRNPPEVGYVLEQGWIYQEGRRWIMRTEQFSKFCGSCFVLRLKDGDLPTEAANGGIHPLVHVPHNELRAKFLAEGRILVPLPFPGAIYCADTGENWSEGSMFRFGSFRTTLRRLASMRPLSPRLEGEFGLKTV